MPPPEHLSSRSVCSFVFGWVMGPVGVLGPAILARGTNTICLDAGDWATPEDLKKRSVIFPLFRFFHGAENFEVTYIPFSVIAGSLQAGHLL